MLQQATHCCMECCIEWGIALPALSSCIRCEKLITIGPLPLADASGQVTSRPLTATPSLDGRWLEAAFVTEISPVQKMPDSEWIAPTNVEDEGPWKVVNFPGLQNRYKLSRGGNVLARLQRQALGTQTTLGWSS